MFTLICQAVICLSQPIVVYDGDTWRANGVRWRLWGISAPERYDAGGLDARDVLIDLLVGQPLACAPKGTSYDRTVVQCVLPDGRDVACAMVKSGHAVDWPSFSGGLYAKCGE